MSFIQVTSNELKSKASELQGLNSRFQTELENLMSHLNTLNSMWEGEAKETFNQAFAKDKSSMDRFKSAIDQYVQALNLIASKYEDAEKKNISTASTRTF